MEAERVVFTAGAWSQDVARLPEGLVRGVRQSLAWLQPTRPEIFEPERMPVFNLALDGEHFYGFPAHGIPGFKLGRYDHFGSGGDPDTIDREPTIADEAPLRAFAERYFPEGAGPTVALKTCLFEPSPDEHFLIDRHPDAPAAVVGAGFSGHGYKFCSVVGEILADLAIDGRTRHDIGLFRIDRFRRAPSRRRELTVVERLTRADPIADTCGREDSNLQGPFGPTGPKPAAFANSATPARGEG